MKPRDDWTLPWNGLMNRSASFDKRKSVCNEKQLVLQNKNALLRKLVLVLLCSTRGGSCY